MHGDLPDQWQEGAGHEVSAALAISLRSADNLTAFAWDLQARIISDEHAAQAEKLILDRRARWPATPAVGLARVIETVTAAPATMQRTTRAAPAQMMTAALTPAMVATTPAPVTFPPATPAVRTAPVTRPVTAAPMAISAVAGPAPRQWLRFSRR